MIWNNYHTWYIRTFDRIFLFQCYFLLQFSRGFWHEMLQTSFGSRPLPDSWEWTKRCDIYNQTQDTPRIPKIKYQRISSNHIKSIQFSFNQFQSRSSPSKPLKIHQTWEYGFPKTGSQNSLYRMLCTPPRAPSHESMFHPGFGSQIWNLHPSIL